MNIDRETIDKMADIAHLYLTDQEKDEITDDLNSLLGYFNKLDEIDLDSIMPTTHVVEDKNVFREDKVWESLPIEDVMKNAPDNYHRFFRVPKIIEE